MKQTLLIIFISLNLNAQDCILGDSLFTNGSYLQAKSAFKNCNLQDSIYAEDIAECAYILGQWSEAKSLYNKVLLKDSLNNKALTKLASIHESESNIPKAIKYYSLLIKYNSSNSYYYRKVGDLYYIARSYLDAITFYNKALEKNESDILSLIQLAQIRLNQSEFNQADTILSRAIILSPENLRVQLLKAKIKYSQKNYKEAYTLLLKLSNKTVLDYKMNTVLGYSAYHIDSLDQAIFHLNNSKVLNPRAENNYYYLGIIYNKLKDYEKAKINFEMAISKGISSKIPKYYQSLAVIAKKENNHKLAIKYYKEALHFDKKGDIYFYLAELSYTYYKDKKIALNYYRKHIKSNSPNPSLVINSESKITSILQELHMKNIK